MASLGQITEKEYNEIDAVRNSDLGNIKRAWSDYKKEKKTTPAMEFGSALHMYVLEEKTFWETYHVAPDYDGRTKEGKAIKAELDAILAEGGKRIIRNDDFETIKAMRHALLNHPTVREILKGAQNEGAYTANIDGVDVKAKFDLINKGQFFDIKTTEDASLEGFTHSLTKFNYNRQGAFYGDIAEKNGIPFKTFNIIAIEKTFPHLIAIYTVGQASIDIGRVDYKKILAKHRYHTENPSAYSFPTGFQNIEISEWKMRQAENDESNH